MTALTSNKVMAMGSSWMLEYRKDVDALLIVHSLFSRIVRLHLKVYDEPPRFLITNVILQSYIIDCFSRS